MKRTLNVSAIRLDLDGGGGVASPLALAVLTLVAAEATSADAVTGETHCSHRRGCRGLLPLIFLVRGWFLRGSFPEVHPLFAENRVILKDGCIYWKDSERMLSDAGGEVDIILKPPFTVLPSTNNNLEN